MKKNFYYCFWISILMLPLAVSAQNTEPTINVTLSGKVVDKRTQETLIGASVQIKGTTNGAITDANGQFTLKTGQKLPFTLVVKYIGYYSTEVVAYGNNVEIALNESNKSLDELVVVGYGTQKRSDITGSISSVPTEIKSQPVASIERLLQGSIAGAIVTQTSGQPGGGVSVQIRGNNSITAGSDPLYVVDGFPINNDYSLNDAGVTNGPKINPLSTLNTADIESIDVLKDASATAIYGSRGANGVIIITTKNGSKNRSSVNYESFYGFQNIILFLLLITSFGEVFSQKTVKSQGSQKPNIILIMVDDLGFSDFGAYGSEILTPNIDKLAFGGLRLREFYNNSICAPTRASLITGQYPHKAGVGYFNVNLGLPAYQGWLNKESLTFGEVLKQAGYNTYITGKWHVGNDSLYWPNQRGFDRFYGFIGGASNYYDIAPYTDKVPPVELVENNKRFNLEPNKYLTDEIGNYAIEYINESKDKPFFLYLAFNAPHWPLQAPAEVIAKYKGKYALGWDSLRVQRLKKQVELGIANPQQAIANHDPEVVEWESLTYDEKELWQRKMEVYAAMVDRADQNIGRVLEELKKLKKDDNTLIFIISDNGAQGGLNQLGRRRQQRNSGPIGSAGSYDYQEQNWASVSNTPFRNYKATSHEGGISSPFIAWFPQKIKAGTIAKGTAHIIDLAPTFYDVAGIQYPETFNGVKTNPLVGESLTPLLFQNTEWTRQQPIFWERGGNRAVRKGKWKIVSLYPEKKWQLYDIEKDRGETTDIASQNPDVIKELNADYEAWAKRTDVEVYDKLRPANQGFPGGGPPITNTPNAGQNAQNPNAVRRTQAGGN